MKALLYDETRSGRLKKWGCFALTPRDFPIGLASSLCFSFCFLHLLVNLSRYTFILLLGSCLLESPGVGYNSATEIMKACMVSFRLHRRHRKLVWDVYSRTDFDHLKQGGG